MFDFEQEPNFGGHAIFGMKGWSKNQDQADLKNKDVSDNCN